MTKSDAIRGVLAENPTATPSFVTETLAKKGIKVKNNQVSTIKWAAKKQKRQKRKTAKRKVLNRPDVVNTLQAAERFISSAGGLAQAKQVLDTLQKFPS